MKSHPERVCESSLLYFGGFFRTFEMRSAVFAAGIESRSRPAPITAYFIPAC